MSRTSSEAPKVELDLRAVLDATHEAFVLLDGNGRIVDWSRSAERTFGWTATEALGARVAELLVPARHHQEVARLLAGERRGALHALHRDGRELPVELSPTRIGRHVASLWRDISERRSAKARLRRYEAIVDASGDAILAGAFSGVLDVFNPAAERLFGYSAEEMIGQSVERLLPEGFASVPSERQALREGLPVFVESQMRRKNGSLVDVAVTLSPLRGDDGEIDGVACVVRDVTDRNRHEASLAEAHDRFAGAFSAASTGMALVGPDGRILEVNEALCRFLGRDADTLKRTTFQELTHPDDLDAELSEWQRVLGGVSDSYQLTKRYLLPDGGIVWGLLTVSVVREPDGRPLYVVGQVHDVTDRKTAEGELRRYAAQLEALSQQDPVRNEVKRPSEPAVPRGVDRLLELARRQLAMPVAFLTRIQDDRYELARLGGDRGLFDFEDGAGLPVSETHCARMLDGRIDSAVGDVAEEPHTRDLAVTRAFGLRAYAGVPVRLPSGRLYGTLCAVDTRPHPEIGERDIALLHFLSTLAAELIDEDEQRERTRRAETAASGVKTLLGALQARDFYTGEHSKEVVELAGAVARRLGLSPEDRQDVEQVALLHDLGKVGIPDAILQKQGPLDEQEWQLMRQHPVVGERIVAGTPGLEHLATAMRAEHERFDGGGYPDGLAGEEIPVASRITLACDAFHAMTSDRPYRPAMSVERAREELRACAGSQFDPRVVEALLLELEDPRE